MKRITIQLSIASLLVTLSSCGANMKPEHPQAYDSYGSRRMPKENEMAAQGDYLKQQEELSKVKEYRGGLYGQLDPKNPKTEDGVSKSDEPFFDRLGKKFGIISSDSTTQPGTRVTSDGVTTHIPSQQPTQAAPRASSTTQNSRINTLSHEQGEVSKRDEPFFDRLGKKFGIGSSDASAPSGSTTTRSGARIPAQQPTRLPSTPAPDIQYPYAPEANDAMTYTPTDSAPTSSYPTGYLRAPNIVPQGSANTYTYYDLADEVIPASPVHEIHMSKIQDISGVQLAMNVPKQNNANNHYNSSAPLVDVPETPSTQDMRAASENMTSQPNLKDVPPTEAAETPRKPQRKPSQPSSKPNIPGRQGSPGHKGPYNQQDQTPETPSDNTSADTPESNMIQDPSAKLYYKNGKPVVTGVMN